MGNRPPTKWEEWIQRQHEKKYCGFKRDYFSISELRERDAYQAQIMDLRDNK